MRSLVLITAASLMASAAADVLTVSDVEKIGTLSGIHTVPKNQATGAGGELNFADAENKLVLMVMVQSVSTYELWRKQYGSTCEPVPSLGNGACRSKTRDFIGYVFFQKGNNGVWVQSMGWKKGGGANFAVPQLEKLAQIASSRL